MKQLYKLLLSFTLLLTMVILVPYTVKAADTEMTIYGIYLESEDKGESVLLESDGHYLLMDIGSSGSVPAIIKQLQKLGVTELDLYFSHLHMDHYGGKAGGYGNTTDGIKQLLRAGIKVNTLYVPDLALSPEADGYDTKYDQIVRDSQAGNTVVLNVGSTFQIGDARAEVLGPVNTDQIHPSDYSGILSSSESNDPNVIQHTYYENNCCLATMFTCGNTKYFTIGDILEDQTNFLVDQYGSKLKADILKLSHHGTGGGNTERFLAAVRPKYAFAQNTGFTGKSSSTKKWLTNMSRKSVLPYGMCYLVANEAKTIIYQVKNDQIRVYENEVSDSAMLDGWVRLTGGDGEFRQIDRYYFRNGEPLTGVQTIAGKTYYFGTGGCMEYGNFNEKAVYQYWKSYDNGIKRYFTFSADKEYSYMATGFTKIGKDTFYFDKNGNKIAGGSKKLIKKIGKYSYLFGTSGAIYKNILYRSGKIIYYFDKNGRMVKNKTITYKGAKYKIDKKGSATRI